MNVTKLKIKCGFRAGTWTCEKESTVKMYYEGNFPCQDMLFNVAMAQGMPESEAAKAGQVYGLVMEPSWSVVLVAPEGTSRLMDFSFRCPQH